MTDENCDEIKFLLDAYHDGEASPAERAEVERHIDGCGECARALAAIEMISGALLSLPPMNSKNDFADRFEEVLAERGAVQSHACEVIAPLLDAYYDNELDASEREMVSNHLPGCDDCNRGLGEIERVVASLKQLAPLVPTKDFADNFEEVLAKRTKVVWFKRRAVWASASVAAAIAMIVMVISSQTGVTPGVTTAQNPEQNALKIAKQSENTSIANSMATSHEQSKDVSPSVDIAQKIKQDVLPNTNKGQNVNHDSLTKTDIAQNVKHEIAIPELVASQNGSPAVVKTTPAVKNETLIADQKAPQSVKGEVSSTRIVAMSDGANRNAVSNDLNSNRSDELIALYDTDENPAEELGLTTDEDGLYAIKL